MFISDKAISNEQEDELGRADFAKKLGEKILNLNDDESKVIALYGDWGKGKTSILNIAASHIENLTKKWRKAKRPVIFKFNPWNFSEQEGLLFAFLQQLFSAVNHRLPATKKNFQSEINKLAKVLGAFEKLPIAGLPLNTTSKAINLIVPEESLESLRAKVDKYFIELEFKVIVLIDDIDRLTENEIRQIFQLLKINADFPNIIYIAAFDRTVVEKALTTEQGISGRDYLEKIVQVGFDIPAIEQNRINAYLFSKLNEILVSVDMKHWVQTRWGNLYYAGLYKLFGSMRDVKRYLNSLSFNFQMVSKEINPIDFIGVEALRVFLPEIYGAIAKNKDLFISDNISNTQDEPAKRKKLLDDIFLLADNDNEIAKSICLELFPKLEAVYPKFFMGTWSGNPAAWRKERRICNGDVFDTYFVMGTPIGEISRAELQQVIFLANEPDKLVAHFEEYLRQGRIRRLFDWLNDILEDLSEDGIFGLCYALIEVGDKLTENRQGVFDIGAEFQLNWLLFHSLSRIENQTKRFNWFLEQVKQTDSLYTVVQHVIWHLPKKEEPRSQMVFDEQQLRMLQDACVSKIELFAKNGQLLHVKNFGTILVKWNEWADKQNKIAEFLYNATTTPETTLNLVSGFLWEGQSHVFGDHVSKREWKLDIKSLGRVVEITKITETLSSLQQKDKDALSEKQKLALELFFQK